jgi:biotin operon repressor
MSAFDTVSPEAHPRTLADPATGRPQDAIEAILLSHVPQLVAEILKIGEPRLGTPTAGPNDPSATAASTARSPSSAVEYIHGLESINQAIGLAVETSRSEILTAQPDGPRPPAVLDAALDTVRDQLATGIRMRTLYQHCTRFDEPTKKYARAVIELGCELRTLDEFFERIIIVDRSAAFIPAAADRTTALKIGEPAIVSFLADLFDRTWDRAAPFPYAPNRAKEAALEIMPEIRKAIRRLLVEGHTDKTIARRLGISERTINTHVASLREDFGAANRLQLGYRLAADELRVLGDGRAGA